MTTEIVYNFDLERAQILIDYQMGHLECNWLPVFKPLVRPHDETLELFTLDPHLLVTPDTFNNLTPKVLGHYNSFYGTNGLGGKSLDAFTNGSVSAMNLLLDDQVEHAGAFLTMQLERMKDSLVFPAVDELCLTDYTDALVACLSGDEITTWNEVLAYNAGVWWFLGFVSNLDVKVKGRTLRQKIAKVVLDRAKKGTIYDF